MTGGLKNNNRKFRRKSNYIYRLYFVRAMSILYKELFMIFSRVFGQKIDKNLKIWFIYIKFN